MQMAGFIKLNYCIF